jgi:hypothetical protein
VVVIGKVEAWWQWRFGQENRSDGEEKLVVATGNVEAWWQLWFGQANRCDSACNRGNEEKEMCSFQILHRFVG